MEHRCGTQMKLIVAGGGTSGQVEGEHRELYYDSSSLTKITSTTESS